MAAASTETVRKPNLRRYYAGKLPSYAPGDIDVRVRVIRRTDGAELDVDGPVETLDWTDGKDGLSGSVVFRRPEAFDPGSLPVTGEQRLRLIVKWGGEWYRLWETKLQQPEIDMVGVMSATHGDDFAALDVGERKWVFRKDKAHPKGWFAHEIVVFAAKALGIRLGAIAKGEKRLGTIKVEGSFAELVAAVYKEEKTTGGRKFIVRMRDRRFEIREFQRNRIVYEVGRDSATALTISRTYPKEPITSLTGKAKIGKGKTRKAVRFTVAESAVIARFGHKSSVKDYGKLPSEAELRERVRRDYADGIRAKRTVEVSNAFIPFVRRGDAVYVDLPTEGFTGERGFLFVESAEHTLTGRDRATSLVLTEEDAYGAYREERDKKLREAARKRKKARS